MNEADPRRCHASGTTAQIVDPRDACEVGASPDVDATLLSEEWERALGESATATSDAPGALRASLRSLSDSAGDEAHGSVLFEQIGRGRHGKDLLLYVPGVDFTGVLAAAHFQALANEGYELWRCFLGTADRRTTFAQLCAGLEAWLAPRLKEGRRVVLLGDAFGGLLALAVSLRLGRAIKGLVLVNPTTAFVATPLWTLGRAALAGLAGPGALLEQLAAGALGGEGAAQEASAVSDLSLLAQGLRVEDSAQLALRAASGVFGARAVLMSASAGTLQFRVRAWLRDGWEVVRSELRRDPRRTLLPPTLLICSSDDRIFPAKAEADQLRPLLEGRCEPGRFEVQALPGQSHEPLAECSLELVPLLRASPIYKPLRLHPDYVEDFKYPTSEQFENASEGVERLASVLSPVFCSTGPDGHRQFGLDGVPLPNAVGGRPVLLVGNHQLLGLDLGPLVREFIVERGIVVRGLAFPDAVRQQEAAAKRNPDAGNTFRDFGAVPVSPRNIFRLLQRGEAVLLFPGGVREAMHGAGEEYRLFWPEKTEFLRVAARFKAVVVPFGGIGVDDNIKVLGRADEVLAPLAPLRAILPGGGGRQEEEEKRKRGGLLPVSESLREGMPFPLVAPQLLPATSAAAGFGDRFYMSFGRPVDLQDLDPADRPACDTLYAELRAAVQREMDWLREARLRDPFRDLLRRQLYERLANASPSERHIKAGPLKGVALRSYGKRAPTFTLP